MQNHENSPSAYKKLHTPRVVLVLGDFGDIYKVLCDGVPWLVMKSNAFLIEGDRK